jgi:anti-anti-sigma factor
MFAGEYDIAHRSALQHHFDALCTEPRSVVLDMSAVTYVDSSFVTELIRVHNTRAARGYDRLTIVRVAPIVRKIFAIFYLGTFCRMVDTLEAALPYDGRPVVVRYACQGDPTPHPALTPEPQPEGSVWVSRVLAVAGA